MDKLWDIMSGYHQLMVDNGDLQIKREKQVRGSFYCKLSVICHFVLGYLTGSDRATVI